MLTQVEIDDMVKDKNVCYNCKFYFKDTDPVGPSGIVVFNKQQCRRNPTDMTGRGRNEFPSVSIMDWCGSFEKAV